MKAKICVLRDREVKTSQLPQFLLRIAKAASTPEQRSEVMTIVIRRPYAYLEKELRSGFEGQEDVKVIVDRRCRERSTRTQPVELERRGADRRRPREEIVEVLLSA